MTSQLRKKHLTTVRNTKPFISPRLAQALFVCLVAIPAISVVQPVYGQQTRVRAQKVGWTNRKAKSWAKSTKPLTDSSVQPTAGLPWRPAKPVADENLSPAEVSPEEIHDAFAENSPAFTESQAEVNSAMTLDSRTQPSMASLPPITIRRIRPKHHAPAIASVQQSLQRSRNSAAQPPANPFDDPFGDKVAGQRLSFSFERPYAEESKSTSSNSVFENPFGDEGLQAPVSSMMESEPLISLSRLESAGGTPSASRRETESIGYQPDLKVPAVASQSVALDVNNPVQERENKNYSLVVHSATESVVPSLSPRPQQDTSPSDLIPEFPEYDTGPAMPPTPDVIEGTADLQNLPEISEPPMPDGYDSGEDSTPDGAEDLPDPNDFLENDLRDADDDPADDNGDDSDEADDDEESDDEDESEEKSNCGRIYNDRDCCDQDENCRTAWDRLNEITISDIDIDISPPLAPLPEDEFDTEEQRERLSKAPFREFRNRSGTIVASGTLEDYVNGNVVIRTAEGTTRSIPFRELGYDERCFFSAWWGIPNECMIRSDQLAIRDWTMTTFTWKASGVCHKTTFFEDVQLERYGHSAGPVLQPLISGAHFFANIGLFPYNAGVYPPTECHYVLGLYRPGECAPWLVPAFPLSKRGAVLETAGLLGFFGLF